MPTDTQVNDLKINVLSESQYEQIQSPSSTELYLVPEVVDTTPTSGSTNPITSGGVYNALQNIPAQEQSDWNETDNTDPAFIKNKPTLGTAAAKNVPSSGDAATTEVVMGDDSRLTDARTPTAHTHGNITNDGKVGSASGKILTTGTGGAVQASDSITKSMISDFPSLATVATSGSYNDLSNKPTIPSAPVQSNWNETDTSSLAYIENKPTIPAAQVNSDWNASSGVAQILNKPSLATVATSGSYNDLSNTPTIPSAPGTMNTTNTTAQSTSSSEALSGTVNLHKVAKTGTYSDLIGTPTIPTLRTVNHEQMTDSSLGDINIHDGFYFPNAVQDYDGNWYGAVVIGDQVWLGENLRTTHLADGTAITKTTTQESGNTAYYYDVSESTFNLYERGLLYNFTAANNSFINNFHLPSKSEYIVLSDYVSSQKRYILSDETSRTAKSLSSTYGWSTSTVDDAVGKEQNANNKTGFNCIPVGYFAGGFLFNNARASFWNSTAYTTAGIHCAVIAYYDRSSFDFNNYFADQRALSIRLVSDLTPAQFRDWYVKTYGTLQHKLDELPSYTNNAGKVLAVNSGATDVEWVEPSGGGDAGVLYCTLTPSGSTYTCDTSVSDIVTAYQSGKVVLLKITTDYRVFTCVYARTLSGTTTINAFYTGGVTASNSGMTDASITLLRYVGSEWQLLNSWNIQEKLISGTNIKTINSESLLGTENINLTGVEETLTGQSVTGSTFNITYGAVANRAIRMIIQNGLSSVNITLNHKVRRIPYRIIIDNSNNVNDVSLTFNLRYENAALDEEIIDPALKTTGGYVLKAGDSMEMEHIDWALNGQEIGLLGLVFGTDKFANAVTIYSGSTAPSSSTGSDGDIYIQTTA